MRRPFEPQYPTEDDPEGASDMITMPQQARVDIGRVRR